MMALARHTFWVFGVTMMISSMALVGCGSNGGGGGAAPGVINPLGPTVTQCTTPGTVATAYGCLYTASCQNIAPGYGWLPGEARCVPPISGQSSVPGSGNYLASGLQIVNKNSFELILESLGLCRTYWTVGDWDCGSYSQAGYLRLQTGVASGAQLPTAMTVVLGAGTSYPGGYNNSGWTTRTLQPAFSLNNIAYTNGTAGFTGTGINGFRLVVQNGLPGSANQMNVELIYNGSVFARGVLAPQ